MGARVDGKRASLKCVVLVLCSALTLGSSYCFHSPAALKNQLQQHFSTKLSNNEYEVLFNMLYTLYSTPNIVLPLVGGILVDKFGASRMLLLLTTLVLMGQVVFALGCSFVNFRIMLIGRAIFGFGGESLGVARTTFIATWFKKRELALALGVGSSFSGLASMLNNILSPWIADHFGVSFALWLSAGICGACVGATLILIPIDHSAGDRSTLTLPHSQHKPATGSKRVKVTDIKHFGKVFWMILIACVSVWGSTVPFQSVAGSILLERTYFREPPLACRRCGEGNYASYTNCDTIVPSCANFTAYAWPLPKLSASCHFQYPTDQLACNAAPPYVKESEINCDNPVWKNGAKTHMFCQRKIEAETSAARVMSLPSLISVFAAPLFGYMVDHVGNRAILAMWATAAILLSQFGVALSNFAIGALLFIQGVACSLFFASLWPSIPYVVEEHHVGSAYGMTVAMGNFALAVVPMVVAAVYRIEDKYMPNVQLLFAYIACCGFISSCLMYYFDQMDSCVLNPPTPRPMTSMMAIADAYDETEHLEVVPLKTYGTIENDIGK